MRPFLAQVKRTTDLKIAIAIEPEKGQLLCADPVDGHLDWWESYELRFISWDVEMSVKSE